MTNRNPASYPDPQTRRQDWIDLRGQWAFAFDDADIGRSCGWVSDESPFERIICVPFPPESRLSGIGDPAPHPIVWYRRIFRQERPDQAHRLLLRFGAVDYRAEVWINGVHLGSHQGGNTSFGFDITDALRESGEQVVVVRAEDDPTDLAQPRGKQFWEVHPRRIWYHRTTGIWQPVWLETVGSTHLAEVRWTPYSGSQLGLLVRLNRPPREGDRVRVRLSRSGTLVVEDVYLLSGRELERTLALERAVLEYGRRRLLWEPDHPNLIDTVLTLEDASGSILDEVRGYVGVRTVGFEDGHFMLNGSPTYLRLVLSQGYWPESHLAAPSDEAIRAEVEWIKRLGFNGVRIHQKVEDPRFLYWCDRLGVMAWSEMASAYLFSDLATERFVREWLEVLRRDHNHPSIVTWVPFNESWGLPDLPNERAQRDLVRSVYHLTKALDPSRPAVGNDGWEHVVGDVLGIHDYAVDGATLRERYGSFAALDQTLARIRPHHRRLLLPELQRSVEPVVLSEFGGISYEAERGKPWYGYGTVGSAEEFVTRYEELVSAVLESPAIAGFCYTQLTDTEQEANGLLTGTRRSKLDPDLVAKINRQPAKSLPGELMASIHSAGEALAYGDSGVPKDPQSARSM